MPCPISFFSSPGGATFLGSHLCRQSRRRLFVCSCAHLRTTQRRLRTTRRSRRSARWRNSGWTRSRSSGRRARAWGELPPKLSSFHRSAEKRRRVLLFSARRAVEKRWRSRRRGSARPVHAPSQQCHITSRTHEAVSLYHSAPPRHRDRLAIIESFCPKLADAATTQKWVEEAIAQIGASKPGDVGKARADAGSWCVGVVVAQRPASHESDANWARPVRRASNVQVMGAVLKAHKGEVDNALVKSVADKILGGKK